MATKALPMMLLFALLVAGAAGDITEASRRLLQMPSRTRPAWTTTNTQTNSGTSAGSGSSGSSSASAGSQASTTGGSASASSSASGAVIQAAAAACASAASDAFGAAKMCKAGQWALGEPGVVAIACSKAAAKVILEGSSSSYASGNSQACANSRSSVSATGTAMARAAADAIAEASGQCAEIRAYVYSEAFSSVFVDVCATAFTSACSASSGSGETSAKSAVNAQLNVMASAFSSAFAHIYATACASRCYPSCVGTCPYASATTNAIVATYAAITNGEFAVTQAMADATAVACGSRDFQAYAESLGKTVIDVCLQAYGGLHAIAYSKTGSIACAGTMIHAELKAITAAAIDLVARAYSTNWDSTCAEAVAQIQGRIGFVDGSVAEDLTRLIIDKYAAGCVSGGTYSSDAYIKAIVSNWTFIAASADAQAQAYAQCLCQNPGCCTSCNYSQTCPALAT